MGSVRLVDCAPDELGDRQAGARRFVSEERVLAVGEGDLRAPAHGGDEGVHLHHSAVRHETVPNLQRLRHECPDKVGSVDAADLTHADPLALAARGLELSGMDYIRAIFAGELPPPPIASLMGFRGVEARPGAAVFEMEPGPQHYNPIGSVHGGVALTLLDSAMGCAVHTLLEAGVRYTTLEVKTNFVRPITAATGVIRCEGTVVHRGARVATAEGRIVDASGKLLAHGTTTCLILGS